MDQHTGGKWLIHGTKRHKDNQNISSISKLNVCVYEKQISSHASINSQWLINSAVSIIENTDFGYQAFVYILLEVLRWY